MRLMDLLKPKPRKPLRTSNLFSKKYNEYHVVNNTRACLRVRPSLAPWTAVALKTVRCFGRTQVQGKPLST